LAFKVYTLVDEYSFHPTRITITLDLWVNESVGCKTAYVIVAYVIGYFYMAANTLSYEIRLMYLRDNYL